MAASLFYYSNLIKFRPVRKEDRKALEDIAFNPNELLDLKKMTTEELRGLMAFCDIRTYKDMPIIACEDNEMRMAYLTWRVQQSAETRVKFSKQLTKKKNKLFRTYDGLMDWMGL